MDNATDVLSFSMNEGDCDKLSGLNSWMLGDIVISVETAFKQAKSHGHSLEKEITILAIHGLLHLLGYDHEIDNDAINMETEERRLLKILGNDY